MPTGYTAQLKEMNFDIKKWLKESVARNFGMCISLRGSSSSLTEQQILENLSQNNSYYSELLDKVEKQLKYYNEANSEDIKKELNEVITKSKIHREEKTKEFYDEKQKHIDSLKKINQLISLAPEEVTLNVLNFSKEQLELVINQEFDRCFYEKPCEIESMNEVQYRDYQIKDLKKKIKYYTERQSEDVTRNNNRLSAYKKLVEFVNENIKD